MSNFLSTSKDDNTPGLSSAALLALKEYLKDEGGASAEDEDDVLGAVKALIKNRRACDDSSDSSDDESDSTKIVIKYDTYDRVHMKQHENVKNVEQPSTLRLALVAKHHSLWAEYVYNAARVLADRIDSGTIDCKGKTCLELGAGAGLPGLVAALTGASASVISDYGTEVDPSLVKAIEMNLEAIAPFVGSDYTIPEVSITTTVYINDEKPENSNNSNSNSNSNSTGTTKGATVDISVGQTADGRPPSDSSSVPPVLAGVGYVWGYPIDPLTNPIGGGKFDLVFLADLIFNRSEHKKLLWTTKQCLNPDGGVAWVTFSHHDPQKRELDLNFFTLAESEEFGFIVEKIDEEVRQSYPFVEQDGMDEQRGVVYVYTLRLK